MVELSKFSLKFTEKGLGLTEIRLVSNQREINGTISGITSYKI